MRDCTFEVLDIIGNRKDGCELRINNVYTGKTDGLRVLYTDKTDTDWIFYPDDTCRIISEESQATPLATDLRYIVFMLDHRKSKSRHEHDGMIFRSVKEARSYAHDSIEYGYCTKFAIGCFTNNSTATGPNQTISMVETYGFNGDVKHTDQMNLFASTNL